MKLFSVDWEAYGTLEIQAESLEEAQDELDSMGGADIMNGSDDPQFELGEIEDIGEVELEQQPVNTLPLFKAEDAY